MTKDVERQVCFVFCQHSWDIGIIGNLNNENLTSIYKSEVSGA